MSTIVFGFLENSNFQNGMISSLEINIFYSDVSYELLQLKKAILSGNKKRIVRFGKLTGMNPIKYKRFHRAIHLIRPVRLEFGVEVIMGRR